MDRDLRTSRRRWIATLSGAVAAGVAGCTSSGDDTSDGGSTDDDSDDGSTDGSDDSADGSDESFVDGGEDVTETVDPSTVSVEENWPMRFYDERSNADVTDRSGPSAPLGEVWSHQFDDTPSWPVVQDGRVFAQSYSGTTYAFEATTGEVLWERDFDGEHLEGDHAPAVSEDAVIVQGQGLNALDPETGETIWTIDDPILYSYPVVQDGVVYTAERGSVAAIDIESGEYLWVYVTDRFVHYVAVDEGRVYAYARNLLGATTDVVAIDAESGDEIWAHEQEHEHDIGSIAAAEGDLFLCDRANGRTIRYDGEDGSEVWNRDVEARASPTLANETLYVVDGAPANGLQALDPETGDAKAGFEPPSIGTSSSPIVTSDAIYLTKRGVNVDVKGIYAYDPETGELLWRQGVDGSYYRMAVTDEVLFGRGPDDTIMALASVE